MEHVDLSLGPVRLRPFAPADLERLIATRGVGSFPSSETAAEIRERMIRRITQSGRFHEGRLDLGIEVEGRLAGSIDARQPREALPPGVYEIGISLFDEADRGRSLGTRALALFIDFLFSMPATARVQASTWVGNTAMCCVLGKLGFACEGVMRAFLPAEDGGRQDCALYGLTRAEWRGRGDERLR